MCESCSNRGLDRREFLASAGALAAIGLASKAVADAAGSTLALPLTKRDKQAARVLVAFLYPPADVVNQGKNEDVWQKHNWFTWPGNTGQTWSALPQTVMTVCTGWSRNSASGLERCPEISMPISAIALIASGASFPMYVKGHGLWIKDTGDEPKLLDALKKDKEVTLKLTPAKGAVTTDRYSLTGLSQALERVAKECP